LLRTILITPLLSPGWRNADYAIEMITALGFDWSRSILKTFR
jgi:hypothetical protein